MNRNACVYLVLTAGVASFLHGYSIYRVLAFVGALLGRIGS